MTKAKKQILPALHQSGKVKNPDMPDVEQQNYTSTVLKYANLALPFPQLETKAKRVVPAINELWDNRVIANPPIPSASYQIESEDGYIIISEDEYIIDADDESGGDVDPLNTIKIDGVIYKIVGGSGYLKDLQDVKLQSLSDGQILRYDSSTERWINVDGGGEYTAGAGIYFTGDNNSIINADAGRKSKGKNVLTFKTEWHYDTSLPDWEDTDTTIDDYIVYQSLGGTYQQTSGDSIGTYTISGATKFTIHLKQDVEDSRYSYVVLGKPNRPINLDDSDYEKSYRGEDIPDYVEYEYTGLNEYGGNSTVQVMFHKEEPMPPVPIGVTLDLNDGQWRDTETTVGGNEVYESDIGSWHINNGESVCTIYINGVTSISLYVSQSSEYYYDYCYIGNLDEPVSKSNYRNTTYGVGAGYVTFTYNCSPEQHFIQLMYGKDGSDYEGEDRGYFYYVVNSMDDSQEVDDTPVADGDSSTDRAWIYGESSNPYLGEHGEVFNNYDNNYATGNYAHAEGNGTTASGDYSHAEGTGTTASGDYSHAEGSSTKALTAGTHTEGDNTTASGDNSHAEGESSIASAEASHAEGHQTQAIGRFTHAEGYMNIASAQAAHAEGNNTIASGENSHTEGRQTQATNIRAHAEGGYTLASGEASHAEGHFTVASGNYSHAEGYYSKAQGYSSHAEGYETIASGENSHTEGQNAHASGDYSHAEGCYTTASGASSHVEGYSNTASGKGAHAEGDGQFTGPNTASGTGSHAEGGGNTVIGNCGHAEGTRNYVYNESGHAEGSGNYIYGRESHAEGSGTYSTEQSSHIEGAGNYNVSANSHVEGSGNGATLYSFSSHTEGAGNTNYGPQSHVEGSGNSLSGEEAHVEGAGNSAHGPKIHIEGGGNSAYAMGSHVEGKHNSVAGYGVHAEGRENCIGSSTAISNFRYGVTYAVDDIVGVNECFRSHGNDEYSDSYLFKCITAPGQIQSGTGVTFITPSSWNSSSTYSKGDVVSFRINSLYACVDLYYVANADIPAGSIPHLNYNWTRITTVLSPFIGKSGANTATTYGTGNGSYTGWWVADGAIAVTLVSVTVDGVETPATIENNGRIIRLTYAPAQGAQVVMTYYTDYAYDYSYYLLDPEYPSRGTNVIAKVQNIVAIPPMWEGVTTPIATHVEGYKNIALGDYQHVQGKYNVADANKAFIIGNGTATDARSNALTVDWSGNTSIAGDLTTGVTLNTTAQTISAAINEISVRVPAPPTTDGTYTLSLTITNGVPTYSWVSS